VPRPTQFAFIIDPELRRRFRLASVAEGVSMAQVLVEFLEQRYPARPSDKKRRQARETTTPTAGVGAR
jgi:hypothetical protein